MIFYWIVARSKEEKTIFFGNLCTFTQVSLAGGAPCISHRKRIVFPDVRCTGPACSSVSGVNVGPTFGKFAKDSLVILMSEFSVKAELSSEEKNNKNYVNNSPPQLY